MNRFKKGDLVRLDNFPTNPDKAGVIENDRIKIIAGARFYCIRIWNGQQRYFPESHLILLYRPE